MCHGSSLPRKQPPQTSNIKIHPRAKVAICFSKERSRTVDRGSARRSSFNFVPVKYADVCDAAFGDNPGRPSLIKGFGRIGVARVGVPSLKGGPCRSTKTNPHPRSPKSGLPEIVAGQLRMDRILDEFPKGNTSEDSVRLKPRATFDFLAGKFYAPPPPSPLGESKRGGRLPTGGRFPGRWVSRGGGSTAS